MDVVEGGDQRKKTLGNEIFKFDGKDPKIKVQISK